MHLFKIFAHLVDGSKLPIDDLSELCQKYLAFKLEDLLDTLGETKYLDDAIAMLQKSQFKVGDLIKAVAEFKNYGTSDQELNIWEINNPSMYLTNER